MSLSTYSGLQTAVLKWLNRESDTDLSAQLPDMITLCEARIKRDLRRSTTRTTITVADEAVDPPVDMAELRAINFVSASPSQDKPLRIGTPQSLAERRARNGGTTGRPTDVAYVAGQLLFSPQPDQTYTAEIVYYTALSPLSNSNATNAVLQEAPDAYLFGTLLETAPYLEHDDMVPVWQAKYDNAIDGLNKVREREEFAASPTPIGLPMVFG